MRSPRRTFAAPFVITIAAGATACAGAADPQPTRNPPPPDVTTTPPPDQNAGAPDQNAGAPDQNAGAPDQNAGGPAPSGGGTTQAPRPTTEMRWTVHKRGDLCYASIPVECPKGEPGKPMPTCNPPPPMKYDCQGLVFDRPVTIVRRAGETDCYTRPEMPTCPPNTACNPPRPQKVACPTR